MQQNGPFPILREEKRQTDDAVRIVLRIRIGVVRRGVARVPQQPCLPLRKERLGRTQAAGIPGVLVRTDAVRVDAIGPQRLQMLVQFIRFAFCGGIRRCVKVYTGINMVFLKIGKLLGQFLPIGEIRAVDRIG